MAAASTASIATTTTTDPTGRILVSASPSSAPASALPSSLRDLPPSASPQNPAIPSSSSAAALPSGTNTTSLTGASANIAHNNSTSTNINIDHNNSSNRNGSVDGNGFQGSVSNNVGTTPDYGAGTASPNPDLRLYPRDGRVRNPVPSKLKGVTEEMRGNFSVMHMDVTSHRESQDRDAAAKLTSESTARQAKLAQTDTYISHHRRANYPRPAGLKQFTSSSSSRKTRSTPAPDAAPKRPLTVAETKAEQARLLTLLRTLPPPTIVDQICKALAFFGGIPDAPPPTDGKFPESAEANGSGSLFVGWFAEIFPDLDNPRRPALPDTLQKRRRGRPKGSKASKVRSDKGIKKGRQKPDSTASAAAAQEAADDGWVDVEDSTLDFNGEGDLVEVSAASRAPLSTPSRGPDSGVVDTTPATGSSTAGFRSINNEQAASTGSGAKRRGRPKGSKNRPKDAAATSQPADQAAAATSATSTVSQPAASATSAPPKVTPVPVPTPALGSQPKKANTGRPKGSKNRLKQGAGVTTTVQPPAESRQQSSDVIGRQDNHASGQVRKGGPSSVANRAPSTINGASGVQAPAQPSTTSGVGITTPLVKESTIVGVKRKRQGGRASNTSAAKEKDTSAAAAAGGSSLVPEQGQIHHPINTQSPTISQIQSQGASGASQQSASVASVDTSTPVTKRARKSKETSSAQAARRQTPNNPGTKDTAPPAEATRQATQPSVVSQSRPSVEGLDAHYERMAAVQNRTDQGQGYTTNRSQRQSQQSSLPVGASVSPPQAEGLEAHYERFAALQTHRQDSTRQPTTSRPQNPPQTISPPLQTSKSSQLPVSLTSQPQTRSSQSYYAQPQPLGSTYSATTQATFAPSQRQQQQQQQQQPQPQPQQLHANSPQYGTQSNSPLLQSDSSYRASPTAAHNSASFVPRRTPSASPLDTNNYRSNGTTSQTLPSQATHFGSRHSAVATTHSASHPSLQSSFQAFSADPAFLDIQGLDSGNSHGGMGLGANPYGLGSNTGHPQQQRTSNAAAAPPVYSQASGLSNYLGSSSVGRAGRSQWPS